MEIEQLDSVEFAGLFPEPYFVYGRSGFNSLNAPKADAVFYLAFKERKYRLGLTLGARGRVLHSPFSAPFGGLVFTKEEVRISYIDDALTKLSGWAREQGYASLHLTLPPEIYHETFVAKQVNALHRAGFSITQIDLNYHFNTSKLDGKYVDSIWHNASKNLRIALGNELSFRECKSEDENRLAYELIKRNREARGFPLKMSWEQVSDTAELVDTDFFLVSHEKAGAIASAVVFNVAKEVAQVIYWGDLPEHSHLKTMNFLSYKIFDFYKSRNVKVVDIGPSTESSVPNLGLCEFKESIGCSISQKLTFKKVLSVAG